LQAYAQDAQWGQPPPNAYAQDAQWGQPPQSYPQNAQWGQMPGHEPLPTVAMMDPVMHSAQAGGECTVALDLDSFGANDEAPKQSHWPLSHTQPQDSAQDDWNAWNESQHNSPAPSAPKSRPSAPPKGQITVGQPLPAGASEGMTRQIDIRDVRAIYGDKVNPIKEFFRSIPTGTLIIAIAFTAAAIVAFAVATYIIHKPEETRRIASSDGEIVDENAPPKPMSFRDVVRDTKRAIPSIKPFDGDDINSATIIGISKDAGILYNAKKVLELQAIQTGGQFNEALYQIARQDTDNEDKPIVLLFDATLPMSVAYRAMYSLGPTGRQILFGGTTTNGITAIEIIPFEWPDHEMFMFPTFPNVNTTLKITRTDLTLKRIGNNPLPLLGQTDGSAAVTEIRDDVLGGRILFQNLTPAFAKMRADRQSTLKLMPDGDVSIGDFLTVALQVRGSADYPNVEKLLLDKVSLR